jgi:spermidine synthase
MPVLQPSPSGNLDLKRSLPPFLLGFLALSFQVILLREFSVHFQGNEMTYGFLLAGWLLWGGLGSLLAHRFKANGERFLPLLCAVLVLFPVGLAGLRVARLTLGLLPAEITGLALMLALALILTLFLSFPFGMLFVAAAELRGADAPGVYRLEALGAATAGLLVHFLLIPHLSNWQTAGLIGLAALGAGLAVRAGKVAPVLPAAAGLALILFMLFDGPAGRLYWKPLELVRTKDTPYGKLQAVRTDGDISLYINSVPAYSTADPSSAEEAVHFALLQRPVSRRALLIGGGGGGALEQALKYPGLKLDYVELDPEVIRMSKELLPPEKGAVFSNPRVRIFTQDGRAFLSRTKERYDAVLLDLPEPSTAQLNRFYTRQFFELARSKLTPEGLLSLRVPSAENYISPARQRFLGSLYQTLKVVFPEVDVVPGGTNIFLASASPLILAAETLNQDLEKRGIRNTYVRPELLRDRLNPLRVEWLRRTLTQGPFAVNSDLHPLCYFFVSILWATQFRGLEAGALESLSRLPPLILLGLPLVLALLILLILRIKSGPDAFLLVPLSLLGFSGIVVEILVLVWYQTLYGAAYGRIALLLASFMAGLWLGSTWSQKWKHHSLSQIKLIQAGLCLLVGTIVLAFRFQPPQAALFGLLLIFGILSGSLFVTANHLFVKSRTDLGTGYGLDLLGSFLGALVASGFFIPLAGLPLTAALLLGLNLLAMFFLLSFRGIPKIY